jgi:hypothetical protein
MQVPLTSHSVAQLMSVLHIRYTVLSLSKQCMYSIDLQLKTESDSSSEDPSDKEEEAQIKR